MPPIASYGYLTYEALQPRVDGSRSDTYATAVKILGSIEPGRRWNPVEGKTEHFEILFCNKKDLVIGSKVAGRKVVGPLGYYQYEVKG